MLTDEQVVAAFHRACTGADLAVVEGVMGLFDGSDYDGERASAAQIAKLLGAPVLLVLDISGAARSAAATALGFAQFDPALHLGGFVLNYAGSESHARGCSGPIARTTGRPVLGWLQKQDSLRAPERHLGLVPAGESLAEHQRLEILADTLERHFDIEAILNLAATATTPPVAQASLPASPASASVPAHDVRRLSSDVRPPSSVISPQSSVIRPPPSIRPTLAVARDGAFCFYYPDNLDLLAAAGARLAFFSPVAGEAPSPEAAGVYLGGGYPELHAATISANTGFRDALRALHARGAPVFAECGGFMVLTEALVDLDGRRWPMVGLVPGEARMTAKLAALGYRHATALADNLLVPAGTTLRGHEFHYSVWDAPDRALAHAAWRLRGTRTDAPETCAGYAERGLLASYLHLPFAQNPALAARLVARLSATTSPSQQPLPHTSSCT
jgi:cobyrinic acid a,c-diamide synthase